MLSQLLALSLGLKIFLLIVFLIVTSALLYLLFLGIKKDHKRYKYERARLKDLKKEDFAALLKEYVEGETPKACSLIFVQINAAKEYRDRRGEAGYAWALGYTRERISSVLPKSSKVSLYEYDTYAFLLEGEYTAEQLNDYAAKCILKAHAPVVIGPRKKKAEAVDVMLGVASFHPSEQIKTDEVLKRIEVALAVSGRIGLNDFAVYSPDLIVYEATYHYYRALKEAINENEISLRFQPIRHLFNGNAIAYEASFSWVRPEIGPVRPEKFLHIIEQSGDINWLGLWAYEQMLIAYKRFLAAHPDSKVIFSINLTPAQLANPDICDELYKLNEKYEVPTYVICFEVGEVAILGRDLMARESIEKLSQCGYLLALDSVMVDDSTVSRIELRKAFNWVKLDKRYTLSVQEAIPDIKNTQKLLELAHENKFVVIAQDIKDSMTEAFIKRLGIFCGQGYCLGKPEPIEKYLEPTESSIAIKKGEPKVDMPAAAPPPEPERPDAPPQKEEPQPEPTVREEKESEPEKEGKKAPEPKKEEEADGKKAEAKEESEKKPDSEPKPKPKSNKKPKSESESGPDA